MNKIKIKDTFIKAASAFSSHRYVKSINAGIGLLAPLLLFGGFVLILLSGQNFKSISFWYYFAHKHNQSLRQVYDLSLGIVSLFLSAGVSYNLAKHYQLEGEEIDPLSSAIISMVAFLIISTKISNGNLDLLYLGSKGFFTAIINGVFTVELSKLLISNNIRIKMPEGVPYAVSASFTAMIPMIFNIIVLYGINLIMNFYFQENIAALLYNLINPFLYYADSAIFVAIIMLISQILWTMGLHGGAVTGVITSMLYTSNLLENATAYLLGESLPFVMTGPLSVYIVVMGGAGASLGLMLLMNTSKSKRLKMVGKEGFTSSFFGINEPILYGTPLIGNEHLRIPFIITPIVNIFIAYGAVSKGFISASYITIPWASPSIIGLPITNMNFNSVYLVLLVVVVDMIIYYPFYKKYEKELIQIERENL